MFEIEAVNVKTSQGRLEEKLQRNHKKRAFDYLKFFKKSFEDLFIGQM